MFPSHNAFAEKQPSPLTQRFEQIRAQTGRLIEPLSAEDCQLQFNSYYNGVGDKYPCPKRGLISRPSLQEVLALPGAGQCSGAAGHFGNRRAVAVQRPAAGAQ